ncbi:unnamed protein product [Parnassius mnemosyne]|uniref:N-acetyltransferase domain-containing protein n=1 Tax=Parnassius mnemosyne TaxID=213953 RepID=A0AAV1KR75_9NEOP
MESLVKVPYNLWPQLRDLYLLNWPKGASAYCLLDTQINNPKLRKEFNFTVFSPFGDINNGMIGFTHMGESVQVIILPVNNTVMIEKALLITNLIDWNRNVLVPFASPDVVDCLLRLSKTKKITIIYENGKGVKHLLEKNSTIFNISFPDDTYIASLTPEYIETVDKTWSYYSKQSNEFFKTLMDNDMTYVLYSSNDHKPLAWVTINEAGALTHLFCLEPFRGRGYAETVTKFACNDLLKKGRNVLAYTIEDNKGSQKLLDKIGFKVIGYDYWVFIKKDS